MGTLVTTAMPAAAASPSGAGASAPDAPNSLQVNGIDCTNTPISVSWNQAYLTATPQSAANPNQDLTVDYWPVNQPDQVIERSVPGAYTGDPTNVYLSTNALSDGTTYAWNARGTVDGATGPSSQTCEFTAEYTPPANAPLISSTDYPSPGAPNGDGGSGIPGTFTFQPNGDTSAASYWYGWNGNTTMWHVQAGSPGGPATVSIAPNGVGATTLSVVVVDAAGNAGPMTDYPFTIKDNRPVVSCGPVTYAGVPVQCTFSPGAATSSAVVGYAYGFTSGFTYIPVSPDGTATVGVTPTQDGEQTLNVDAVLANGNSAVFTQVTMDAARNAPTVTGPPGPVGVGQPVTVTLQSVLPGSVTFTYQWGNDAPASVPVGADCTATVTLAGPSTPGAYSFLAHSVAADGTVSDPGGTIVTVVSDPSSRQHR
jgi:hypothetical protein